jgi:hypothetical protein
MLYYAILCYAIPKMTNVSVDRVRKSELLTSVMPLIAA